MSYCPRCGRDMNSGGDGVMGLCANCQPSKGVPLAIKDMDGGHTDMTVAELVEDCLCWADFGHGQILSHASGRRAAKDAFKAIHDRLDRLKTLLGKGAPMLTQEALDAAFAPPPKFADRKAGPGPDDLVREGGVLSNGEVDAMLKAAEKCEGSGQSEFYVPKGGRGPQLAAVQGGRPDHIRCPKCGGAPANPVENTTDGPRYKCVEGHMRIYGKAPGKFRTSTGGEVVVAGDGAPVSRAEFEALGAGLGDGPRVSPLRPFKTTINGKG